MGTSHIRLFNQLQCELMLTLEDFRAHLRAALGHITAAEYNALHLFHAEVLLCALGAVLCLVIFGVCIF